MFNQYPKKRLNLPKEYSDIYTEYYKINRSGDTMATSMSKKMESWLHRQVAADLFQAQDSKSTLEIGAGNLNQLQYEPVVGPYDIVEPFRELFRDSEDLSRIRTIYSEISEISGTHLYDRITAVATLEHVCDLPQVVARSGQLLKPNGALRVAVPSEGSLLWILGWKLTTGIEFKLKYGLDYGLLRKYEHVNTAKEIRSVLTYFYNDVQECYLGFHIDLSFYASFVCTDPDLTKCADFSV